MRRVFKTDPLYPRVTRAVHELLKRKSVVAPVEVLIEMSLLTPTHLTDWRMGRIPYLEKVVICNLSKCVRILELLRRHAEERGLKPSLTEYRRWGKHGRRQPLRFTKTGNPHLERQYACHYFAGPPREPHGDVGTMSERSLISTA